ncbi:MAG: HAD hydrolase family protein [bacterium]|nr:HAD hydrolase family protein [bacterium]
MSAHRLLPRLFVMDVDGTLTDGRLTLLPDGGEVKQFHVRDGVAVQLLRAAGITPAIVSGRDSEITRRRARELHVDDALVRLAEGDKRAVVEAYASQLDLDLADVAFMGDDLSDIPAMQVCGFSAAPLDAAEEVLSIVDYMANVPGGAGALRDVVQNLLTSCGVWGETLARYLARYEGAAS